MRFLTPGSPRGAKPLAGEFAPSHIGEQLRDLVDQGTRSDGIHLPHRETLKLPRNLVPRRDPRTRSAHKHRLRSYTLRWRVDLLARVEES